MLSFSFKCVCLSSLWPSVRLLTSVWFIFYHIVIYFISSVYSIILKDECMKKPLGACLFHVTEFLGIPRLLFPLVKNVDP